ncbi:hypothetical protein CR513_12466, partial [Mucuna pruriens]
MVDRSMIDAASGGALMDKTLAAARQLIFNIASNTQQFWIRGTSQPRMVNGIGALDNLRLENQLTKLTSLVRQLAVGQHQPSVAATVCGICTSVEHPTDMCPTLQETKLDYTKSVGAIGGYQYGNWPFDNKQFGRPPYRPNPNQGSYAAQGFSSNRSIPQSEGSYQQPRHHVPPFQQQQQKMPPSGDSPSLEDMSPRSAEADLEVNANSRTPLQEKAVPLPFPSRTISARKLESDDELLKMFRKVEINIPLLDAIKQVPKYAKFLKELCVHKRKKMKGSVQIGGIVSALTRSEDFTTGAQPLPKKC